MNNEITIIKKGFSYFNQGHFNQALVQANKIHNKSNLEAIILSGMCYFKLNKFNESIEYLDIAQKQKPFDKVISLYYLENLYALGDYQKGIGELERKQKTFNDERFCLIKIKFLERNGNYDKAIIEADKLTSTENKLIQIETLAWNYELLNQIVKAEENVKQGLNLDITNFRCNIVKAKILIRKSKNKKALSFVKNIQKHKLSDINKSIYYSLKAQIYEKLKKFNKAFKYHTKSNTCLKNSDSYAQLQGKSFYSEASMDLIDNYFKLKPSFKEGIPATQNITFMVGFPRSGTTLLENILDSHSQITTLEEKPIADVILKHFLNDSESISKLDELTIEEVKQLQDQYISERNKYIEEPNQIIIDKLPLNLIHIGILYRIFPNAKFIISLRDIRDVALSCYFQNFQLNDAMANFLDWKQTSHYLIKLLEISFSIINDYPIQAKIIEYEKMVDNPNKVIKKVINFLKLEWEDSIYDYRKKIKGKNITTPSYAALSKKINTKQKQRWKKYKKQTKEINVELIEKLIKRVEYKLQ